MLFSAALFCFEEPPICSPRGGGSKISPTRLHQNTNLARPAAKSHQLSGLHLPGNNSSEFALQSSTLRYFFIVAPWKTSARLLAQMRLVPPTVRTEPSSDERYALPQTPFQETCTFVGMGTIVPGFFLYLR